MIGYEAKLVSDVSMQLNLEKEREVDPITAT